jgi:hypothetical protein
MMKHGKGTRQERKQQEKMGKRKQENQIKGECEIQMRMVIDTRKFSDKLATESLICMSLDGRVTLASRRALVCYSESK